MARFDPEHFECVNHINYTVATSEEDVRKVVDFFFDFFLADEPATKSKGSYNGERPPAIERQIYDMVKEGASILATDPNADNLPIGIRTGFIVDRATVSRRKPSLKENMENFPMPHAALMYIVDQIASCPEVFDNHPEVNKLYDMYALGTHRDYRGRGIGSELIRQAWKAAKAAGCDGALVVASHDHSRKIFDKFGMTQIASMDWKDFVIESYFDNVEFERVTSHFIKF